MFVNGLTAEGASATMPLTLLYRNMPVAVPEGLMPPIPYKVAVNNLHVEFYLCFHVWG